MLHLFRTPALNPYKKQLLLNKAQQLDPKIADLDTEICFNIEVTTGTSLSDSEWKALSWLLSETFEPHYFSNSSFFPQWESKHPHYAVVEVGPRLNFTTAWSTNTVSVCHNCNLTGITRIECSTRYLFQSAAPIPTETVDIISKDLYDQMTECVYKEPLQSFKTGVAPKKVNIVPIMEEGRAALEKLNKDLGLAFDDRDLQYYYDLFANQLKRNPTDVECFDMAQSNSEHSRHWYFSGKLVIDGQEVPHTMMQLVKQTLLENKNSNKNSVLAFCDNSSAIKGFTVNALLPTKVGQPSDFAVQPVDLDITFTAETHNFPTGVAPFPGAETGSGGRIRDGHAAGRGSLVLAGTAGYCVGNLHVPGYTLPWEDESFVYPANLATPLKIEIEASNGASDYGNKFGEPLICGFTRSFGMTTPQNERREWIKPIMFSGGIGQIDHRHLVKEEAATGMVVVKLGGPAYRIGMGGGAASSMVQGENKVELDFNAVQRGDAEMEQKLNRVIRSCVELGSNNPIIAIHDQGAGGCGNVIKEIVNPAGAVIDLSKVHVGDETMSVMEIWGAEYQEQDAVLIKKEHANLLKSICERERLPVAFVGDITGDGNIVVKDPGTSNEISTPVNLPLEKVLGKMPPKTFQSEHAPPSAKPLSFPADLTVKSALERVLKLLSVGSKRFLTNKVDRSVTGLIAQQQCVGPLHTPLADVAVIAQSYFGITGAATSIGEQPIKGLVDTVAMAGMCVGEAVTNLMWAKITALGDVKCSGNWMWAAKLPGEGAIMYDAVVALKNVMVELGLSIDGGKDSLSMAAKVPKAGNAFDMVKAPGALVVSTYVTCPDITKTVTPDLKNPGDSTLLYIDLGHGKYRLGGSALAQVFNQLGNEVPTVDTALLKQVFETIQTLVDQRLLSAGHDISDGGLITTFLEMAFSGNCGVEADLDAVWQKSQNKDLLALLFAEELGAVVEVRNDRLAKVTEILRGAGVEHHVIGTTTTNHTVTVKINGQTVIQSQVNELRDIWEMTSYHLEKLQANPKCVENERKLLNSRKGYPKYNLSFEPKATAKSLLALPSKPRVAILREEGSNGDREMTAAFYSAGFDPWDVTMSDLLAGRVTLDTFRGLAFVGGFSYADVLGSAKGWGGVIKFHETLQKQFNTFYKRPDTFSLGVCNGCQLMALLGWVPGGGVEEPSNQPRFVGNLSGRFESRFVSIKIGNSPSVMLKGMEGSVLGVWVSHGEGRALFPSQSTLQYVLDNNLAPLRYADDAGEVVEVKEEGDGYPLNPNGSPHSIAGLCTPDGRHLAFMPHPERSFLMWQWPWAPQQWRQQGWCDPSSELMVSPWIKMFQNAYEFCVNNPPK